jgi:hypothetical protein
MFRFFIRVMAWAVSLPVLGALLISVFGSRNACASSDTPPDFLQLNDDTNRAASYSNHGGHGSHSSSHGSHSSSHGSHSSSHGSHSSGY